MPLPVTEIFTPEMRQLIELVERSLHHIARSVETREQAIAIKQRMLLPIGGMNARFGLQVSRRRTSNTIDRRGREGLLSS